MIILIDKKKTPHGLVVSLLFITLFFITIMAVIH